MRTLILVSYFIGAGSFLLGWLLRGLFETPEQARYRRLQGR